MRNPAKVLAIRTIEEIDNQLRLLTQERDEAPSEAVQTQLDGRIERRLRERLAWERLLWLEDFTPPVWRENHKKAS